MTYALNLGVDFTSPGEQADSSVWSLGYSFMVNSPTTVIKLGAYDYGQNGFAQAQQVGLWDSNHTLLASTFVDNSDTLQGFWRFHSIIPLVLTVGDTYYVASQGGEGYTFQDNGLTVAPQITFLLDAWHYNNNSNNNPLAFPDSTDNLDASVGGGFFGGNVELGSVPEPSTMLLLGSGLIGLVGYGRKKFLKK